jgi:hypothetical protein
MRLSRREARKGEEAEQEFFLSYWYCCIGLAIDLPLYRAEDM